MADVCSLDNSSIRVAFEIPPTTDYTLITSYRLLYSQSNNKETMDGKVDINLLRYTREVAVLVGLVLVVVGLADVSIAAKTITLRPSPAWLPMGLGTIVVVFAWMVPITRSADKSLDVAGKAPDGKAPKLVSEGQLTEPQREVLSNEGVDAEEFMPAQGELDGRLSTIYLLRHYEKDYHCPSQYAAALYWWFRNEAGRPISYEEFEAQKDAWIELSREKSDALLRAGFLEPMGSEYNISKKARSLLLYDEFRGRNARAFNPRLIMHSKELP